MASRSLILTTALALPSCLPSSFFDITLGESTDSESSGGEPSPGSTTEEFLLCGNGEINGLEECDEATSLCHDCKRDRFAFVTAIGRRPDGIGGLKGADSLCKQFAHKGGLKNWQSYTAWLSDSTTDAKDRIYRGRGQPRTLWRTSASILL